MVLGLTEHHGSAPAQTSRLLLAERRNLASWKVDEVVMGPMQNEEKAIILMNRVLGETSVAIGGVHLWTGLDHDALIDHLAGSTS